MTRYEIISDDADTDSGMSAPDAGSECLAQKNAGGLKISGNLLFLENRMDSPCLRKELVMALAPLRVPRDGLHRTDPHALGRLVEADALRAEILVDGVDAVLFGEPDQAVLQVLRLRRGRKRY